MFLISIFELPVLLPLAIFILLSIFVETESFGWATVSTVVFAGAMSWIHWPVIPYLKEHILSILMYVGIYVVAGIVWSFAKWFLLLIDFKNQFQKVKKAYKEKNNIGLDDPIPPENMKAFNNFIKDSNGYWTKIKIWKNFFDDNPYVLRLQALEYKSRIIAWASFWPCSMAGYVLNDPVRRLFTWLFELFSNSYQRLSNKILNDPEFTQRKPEPKSGGVKETIL